MVASFFASVVYYWSVYYRGGYATCLRRIYEAGGAEAAGKVVDGGRREGLSESDELQGRALSL